MSIICSEGTTSERTAGRGTEIPFLNISQENFLMYFLKNFREKGYGKTSQSVKAPFLLHILVTIDLNNLKEQSSTDK